LLAKLWIAILCGCLLPAPVLAATGSGRPNSVAPQQRKKKKKHRVPVYSGFQVPRAELRTTPLPRPTGQLKLLNSNTGETLAVELYTADGQFREESLEALSHFWRCRRTGTERPVDPRLFEILSLISDHFGGRTLELVSGFRNQRRVTSFHFHGSAADVRIAGISDQKLHRFAATLDTGNMGLGLYPRAGFIHVDVRPDASYRWVDYSPPGQDLRHPKPRRSKNT
jgi:uncharacterized protein YcbK (DUF882 family)